MDFTTIKKKRVIVKNEADAPYSSVTDIMSFTPNIIVQTQIQVPAITTLNPDLVLFPFLSTTIEDKYYTLYELTSLAGESLGVLINGVHMGVEDDVFELAKDYDLHFINLTPDMHPMHMHLVNFQCYKEPRSIPINTISTGSF